MQAIKELLPAVLAQLQTSSESTSRGKLMSEWPSIAGPRLSNVTRPALTEKGELIIWVKQSTLAFEITCKHAEISEPFQTLVWHGIAQCVGFNVMPADHVGTILPVKVTVMQDRVPIGQIRFNVTVRPAQANAPERTLVGEATRYRKAPVLTEQ